MSLSEFENMSIAELEAMAFPAKAEFMKCNLKDCSIEKYTGLLFEALTEALDCGNLGRFDDIHIRSLVDMKCDCMDLWPAIRIRYQKLLLNDVNKKLGAPKK